MIYYFTHVHISMCIVLEQGNLSATYEFINFVSMVVCPKAIQRRWLSLSQVAHVGGLLPYMADSQKIRYLRTRHIKPDHLRSLNQYFDKF